MVNMGILIELHNFIHCCGKAPGCITGTDLFILIYGGYRIIFNFTCPPRFVLDGGCGLKGLGALENIKGGLLI